VNTNKYSSLMVDSQGKTDADNETGYSVGNKKLNDLINHLGQPTHDDDGEENVIEEEDV
jgi:hypothetical protein